MSAITTRSADGISGAQPVAAAAGSIRVDFDQLHRLARDLRAAARAVADRDSILRGCCEPDLAAALQQAEADWSSHRRSLGAFLDTTASAIEDTAAGYGQVERQIAHAGQGRASDT